MTQDQIEKIKTELQAAGWFVWYIPQGIEFQTPERQRPSVQQVEMAGINVQRVKWNASTAQITKQDEDVAALMPWF